MKATIENPRVFISYAWASEEYQDRVLALATDLVQNGVDVELDKWSLKEGNDTYAFMEKSVTDPQITNVLILLDPMYEKRSNERKGGVGTETQIISPEVYNKVKQDKFLPVIFQRNDDGSIPKPTYLKGILHFDLSQPDKYDDEYQRLVRRLYGIETYQKPQLGTRPAWLDTTPTVSSKIKSKVEYLKKNNIQGRLKLLEYRKVLNEVAHRFMQFGSEEEIKDSMPLQDYLDLCTKILPIRDEFLDLFKIEPYIENGQVAVADILEELMISINENRSAHILTGIRKTLMHELFIYLLAIYIKLKDYESVSYTLNRTYFCPDDLGKIDGHCFSVFYYTNQNLNKAMSIRDDTNYNSGTAMFWIENLNLNVCSKKDFILADIICYNAALYGANYTDSWTWFPITYIYDNYGNSTLRDFALHLKSKAYLKEYIKMFGYSSVDEFKSKYSILEKQFEDERRDRYRYNLCFVYAPVFCDYVKSEQLATLN